MSGPEFSANRIGGKIGRYAGRVAATLAACGLLLRQASGLRAAEDGATCAALEAGPVRTVTRVIDGETLALDDGSELRFAGTLGPRAIDIDAVPGTWRLETAAIEALQALVLGRSIEIRFSGGERRDRYGRIKGHALLKADDGTGWVQGRLLTAGLARAYSLGADRGCAGELLAAERSAREARVGVWAEAAYAIRAAEPSAALLRDLATFQLVEGRVARVATTRGSVYLNFGTGRRRGFSASLKLGDRDRLGAFAANPKGLEGSLVRVRGWIAQRSGEPFIDLSAAGDLEVIAK